jgi:hypothetical protein
VRGVLGLLAALLLVLCGAGLGQGAVSGRSIWPPAAEKPVSIAPAGRALLSRADAKAGAAAGLMPASARSLLKINSTMRYGEFVWNERDVPAGRLSVFVDLRSQLISVYRGPHEIGSAVILYGTDSYQTPLGVYPVMSKDRDYWSRSYDAPMPFALRLTDDGVAIHGSDVRWGAATHGCIGVPLKFAKRLFEAIDTGDPVTIVRTPDPGSAETRT